MKITYYLMLAAAAFLMSCNVEKTESGEAPELDVDVQTQSGELPEYDVNWANVSVGERTKTVKVPKVVVVMEEKEVEVPYLDFNIPNADRESEERTVKVEAEVSEFMHELEIEKVYAVGNKLVVVSELEKENEPLQENRVRVSDQIIVNAPDNLMVRHYIMGDRPEGGFNMDYIYITDENEIKEDIGNATVIFED